YVCGIGAHVIAPNSKLENETGVDPPAQLIAATLVQREDISKPQPRLHCLNRPEVEAKCRGSQQAVASRVARVQQRIALDLEHRHNLFNIGKWELVVRNRPAEDQPIFKRFSPAVRLRSK